MKSELFCWKYLFWKRLCLYWLIAPPYFFVVKITAILTFIKWFRFQHFLNIYFTIFLTSDIFSCWSYSPFGLLTFIHIIRFIAIFIWKYFLSLWNEGVSDLHPNMESIFLALLPPFYFWQFYYSHFGGSLHHCNVFSVLKTLTGPTPSGRTFSSIF